MAITAIIFDYYETLAELSTGTRERVFDDLARGLGVELPPTEAFRQWRELTTRDFKLRLGGNERPSLDGRPIPFVSFRDVWLHRMAQLFAHWGVDEDAEIGYAAYRDAHAHAVLYPEVRSALDALRSRYRLAVLSDADGDFLTANLQRNRLAFEVMVSSEDVQAYKPHVSLFREACARLGVAPEAAVYVGDSPWADIAGARNAGLRAVWVNRHGIEWPSAVAPSPDDSPTLDISWPSAIAPPEMQITSLTELASLIEA